jgi:histidinol-phosphate/aromatic aminotransferase/cobyric acid decarboxylase-like protein
MTTAGRESIYHGGAFFGAIGEEFDTLDRAGSVISADVLDAWFPPSPSVLEAIRDHLPFLVRTSPPTTASGLVRTIARVQQVPEECVLVGGGSSNLIFLALTRWLTASSRVLILDPMYGEYAHVLERVIGCRVDRLSLSRSDDYALEASRLLAIDIAAYDLVIVVNPNSPTGQHVSRESLAPIVAELAHATRVWIDETYIEFAGEGESLEDIASANANVVVCKSLSKVYGLSGLRVGYLVSSPETIGGLRPFSPPWAVGLIGQLAVVHALNDLGYYRSRWMETHRLRAQLTGELFRLGMDVVPSVANFLLCHLPSDGPDASTVVARARAQDLYLRELNDMGTGLGAHAFRIAVKDAASNSRMAAILKEVLAEASGSAVAPGVLSAFDAAHDSVVVAP